MERKIKNIAEYFFIQAHQFPDRMAIIDKGVGITYAVLSKEVLQIITYYRAKGITSGDRVLVFIPMSLDLYRAVLALFAMGATAVFVDEWADKNRLKAACALANCKGFIGGWKARLLAWWEPTLRRIPIRLKPNRFANCNPAEKINAVDLTQEALVTFTTGSTGNPKGAQRTHQFLEAQLKAIQASIHPQPGTVALSNLPIVQFIFLSAGMTTVLPDIDTRNLAKLIPDDLARQMQAHKVKLCIASPFIAMELSKAKVKCEDLRALYIGGGAVFPADAEQLIEAFPAATINVVYGSTEAEPISMVAAEELIKEKSGQGLLVGKPHHFTQLKIVDHQCESTHLDSLDSIELSRGKFGEIIVAGDHVLANYIGAEKEWMAQKIKVNKTLWHRTGDSGYLDEQGNIRLTGRCKQLIRLNGDQYIAPFVIEAQLSNLLEVSEGALVKRGGVLKVFLVLKEKLSERSEAVIKDWLSNEEFEICEIDNMPKDARHHTKIDYGKLG